MPEKAEFLIFWTKTNAVVPYPTGYNKLKPAYSLYKANNAMKSHIWSTIWPYAYNYYQIVQCLQNWLLLLSIVYGKVV